MEFSQDHSVGEVMEKITLSPELGNKKPHEMDLRFFSEIHFGDTFDGNPNPLNGIQYDGILYGNQIVYAFTKRYTDGAGGGSCGEGSVFFYRMSIVAIAYLEILKIARRQYFNEKLPSGLTREERKEMDRVWIDAKKLRMLKEHPQYLDLVASTGLRLVRLRNTGKVSVKTSKHR